jgi:hypothetical protein
MIAKIQQLDETDGCAHLTKVWDDSPPITPAPATVVLARSAIPMEVHLHLDTSSHLGKANCLFAP